MVNSLLFDAVLLCKQLVGRKLSKAGIVGWLTEVLKEKCPSVIFHLELRIAVHFSLHFASDSPARLFEQKKREPFKLGFTLESFCMAAAGKKKFWSLWHCFFWHRQPGGVLNPLFCHRHSTANLQLLFLQQSWRNYNKRSLLCLNFSRKRMNDRPVIFSLSLHGFWTNSSVKKYRSMLF